MRTLTAPLTFGRLEAPSRIVFGPHETNLGSGRALSPRHVAYYERRAAGGAGVLITETASVDPSDWPYERAPLASECAPGWREIAGACHPHGTVVLAGLGHRGAQGSSAFSQSVLWAPSPVADVVSREMPAELEPGEIDVLVRAFAEAAALAMESGLDGVEVDAGAESLLRQFHSGLTNLRGDAYGEDRLLLTREVLATVRAAIGEQAILGLRLSCDELAPWAGVTPEHAAEHVDALAPGLDLLVVVRGGPYSAGAYRPDHHAGASFNTELCTAMRAAADGRAAVVLQGSVVDPGAAEAALAGGVADLVEMTRAQIAEPRLVALLRDDEDARVRPCILCNQTCRVRDNRNPIVTCVGEPRSGHETDDDPVDGDPAAPPHPVLVVGAGPAGLECARVLALRGHAVTVAERSASAGGAFALAAALGREHYRALTSWLEAECRRHGVTFEFGREIGAADLEAAGAAGSAVVLATGAVAVPRYTDGEPAVCDPLRLLAMDPAALPEGPVVVDDPVGDSVGVAVAEWLVAHGRDVAIVTADQVVGTQLARTGDLADASGRLQRAGVHRELRALVREVGAGRVLVEDVWTGDQRELPCALLVDCGHRIPDDTLPSVAPALPRAGDCVAPRTVLEAILEGRRRALEISGAGSRLVAGAALAGGR